MENNQVLSFTEYSIWTNSYGMNSLSVRKNFYGKEGWCPFCKRQASTVFSKSGSAVYDFGPWRELIRTVYQCSCGWWQFKYYSYLEEENVFKDWDERFYNSQLKNFSVGDKDIPINILRSYLYENEDKIYGIHDKKMEELVASIFKEHFNCEVELVGKSHDGGIDLILIESEAPIIVQVKRRKKPNKTEGVKEIRDLLGAAAIKGRNKCIFVTTADHFSKEAINSRNQVIENKFVELFELYDYGKFFDILKMYNKNVQQPWETLIKFQDDLPKEIERMNLLRKT